MTSFNWDDFELVTRVDRVCSIFVPEICARVTGEIVGPTGGRFDASVSLRSEEPRRRTSGLAYVGSYESPQDAVSALNRALENAIEAGPNLLFGERSEKNER